MHRSNCPQILKKYAAFWKVAPESVCAQDPKGRLLTPDQSIRQLLLKDRCEEIQMVDKRAALQNEAVSGDLQVTVDGDGQSVVSAGTFPRLVDWLLNTRSTSTCVRVIVRRCILLCSILARMVLKHVSLFDLLCGCLFARALLLILRFIL